MKTRSPRHGSDPYILLAQSDGINQNANPYHDLPNSSCMQIVNEETGQEILYDL